MDTKLNLFNISKEHIINILKLKIPLSFIWLLEHIKNGGDIPDESLRDKQYGERKAYLDGKGDITKYGEELYQSLFQKLPEVQIKKSMSKNDEFERWWNVYPATNSFEFKNKVFSGIQSKRMKKDDCKKLFGVYVTGGRYTAEDIIRATEYHIEVAKDISVKKNENQLSFIPNSERYLRERRFEPYIEFSRKKKIETGWGVDA